MPRRSMSNAETEWLLAVNDAGDFVLRFNGVSWVTLDPTTIADCGISTPYAVDALARDAVDGTHWICRVGHTSGMQHLCGRPARPCRLLGCANSAPDSAGWITGPPDSAVEDGGGLTHVCKYRNAHYFSSKAVA